MDILRGVLKEELQRAREVIPAFKKAIKEVEGEEKAVYRQEIYRLSIECFKLEIRLLKRVLRQKEFAQAAKLSKKINRLNPKAWPR